jgi:alpha-glucoside transport system substrate-binding protein
MKRDRWNLLALLVALLLAVAAAGCGGDDDDEAEDGETAAQVSGSVTILADWTGPEGESFNAVMDGFKQKFPNINARYRPSTNLTQDLSTAVEGGNPPDLAAIPAPGIMRDYFDRGALKSLEFARSVATQNYTEDWIETGVIDGQLHGIFFKGANKSTVWYSIEAFEQAGVTVPDDVSDWDGFLEAAETVKASGIPPFAIGGAEGWTLTDLFENIYARTAGIDKYLQLSRHEIKWTDPSVTDALERMGQLLQSDNLLGGTSGSLQQGFADSVTKVLNVPPQAAMITEGDFVPGVAKGQTQAQQGTDFDFFDFPSITQDEEVVVSGGNVVVMFNDSPAARELVKYLASQEAGEIWARRGGFSSPNKNVGEDVYPDEIAGRAAVQLSERRLAFDMSDLMPGAFGSGDMWTILQQFLRNPDDVDGTAQKLEAAAAKAFK